MVAKNMCYPFRHVLSGSSDHRQYKKTFKGADFANASIFLASIVLLQLVFTDGNLCKEIIIWKNPYYDFCDNTSNEIGMRTKNDNTFFKSLINR